MTTNPATGWRLEDVGSDYVPVIVEPEQVKQIIILLPNPIQLVRQSAKRERGPEVLTAEEIKALLSKLDGPYYVMTFLASVTGLRVSELLALKWEDIDFLAGEIRLTRAIVTQHISPLKTEASQKPIPMDEGLSAVLLDWRGQCPYNQDSDYVFASIEKDGTQPLWPSSAMSKHIRPAAKLAGIKKHVRWHVFRHSFATLLKGNGEDVKNCAGIFATRGQQK